MLVFDTNKQYNKLMEFGFEKYPNRRDLLILCKEWIKEDSNFDTLLESMKNFCQKWNSQFNYAKSESLFLSVINQIQKEQICGVSFEFNSNIKIYKTEIDEINELKDLSLMKVAFIIICLAKWRNVNYIYINTGSSIKVKDIFNLAGIKETGKHQQEILHKLNDIGFIDVQLRPLLKVFVPCIVDNEEVALEFNVCDSMIDYFLEYILPHCERCGKAYEKHNNKQKYCPECAKEVAREQKLTYWNKTRKIENTQ